MDHSYDVRGADAASVCLVHSWYLAWHGHGRCVCKKPGCPGQSSAFGTALVQVGSPSGEPFCLGVPCLSFALPGPQFFSHLGCAALAGGSHEHSGRMLAPCLLVPSLCSLPCPTHPFGTPQLRAAAFLGDALPECTCCCQRLKNVNVSASLEAGKN